MYTELQNEFTGVVFLTDPKQMRKEAIERLYPLLEGISLEDFKEALISAKDLISLRLRIGDIVSQYKIQQI